MSQDDYTRNLPGLTSPLLRDIFHFVQNIIAFIAEPAYFLIHRKGGCL